MPKLTVLITCKDEELHIRDCIESVRAVADEILVADSGSRDATLEIVRSLGNCRIVEREFISYADFKNWAIPQCTHPWVLIIDADERVTPVLTKEIKALLSDDPDLDACWINRENYFLGHRIRYSGWNNDRVVRLIRRDACVYFPRPVHEAMNVASGKVSVLKNGFEHYTAWDIEHFVAKQNNYSTRSAMASWSQGKRATLAFALVHAPFRFLQFYLLRGGILDGYPGLMVCGITAFYTFLKDIKLWGLEHTKNPPPGMKRPDIGSLEPRKKAA